MKLSIALAILGLTSVLLSVALASRSNKIDKVQSEVMSYVYHNMGKLRMMRGNPANLQCYNGFIPLINSLTVKAKETSEVCVNNANDQKVNGLNWLKNNRSKIDVEIAQISKYFEDCSATKGLEYFICQAKNADNNLRLMESINNQSREIPSKYADITDDIDRVEQTCINDAVDKAKSETDKAFDDLKLCLSNGITFR